MKGYDNSKNPYWGDYQAAGKKYGIDPELLSRMGFAESSWKPDAVGKTLHKRKKGDQNAIGIAQFMPSTAAELGLTVEDLKDPHKSIDAQGRYLSNLRKQFDGNLEHAIAAYNWGGGNVKTHLAKYGSLQRDRLPSETSNYLGKIWDGLGQNTPVKATAAAPTVGAIKDLKVSGTDRVAIMQSDAEDIRRATIAGKQEATFDNTIGASFRRTNALFAMAQNSNAVHGYERTAVTDDDMAWLKESGVEGAELEYIVKNWHGREAAENQQELLAARHMDAQAAAKLGVVGAFLLDSATSFLDPINVGLGLIPGGALLKGAQLAGYANKSRAALMVSSAATGAATNIAADHILAKELGTESDPLVNGAVGAALGALGGMWAKHTAIPSNANRLAPLDAAVEKAQLDATAAQLEAQGIVTDRQLLKQQRDFKQAIAKGEAVGTAKYVDEDGNVVAIQDVDGRTYRADEKGYAVGTPLRDWNPKLLENPVKRIEGTVEGKAGTEVNADPLRTYHQKAIGQDGEPMRDWNPELLENPTKRLDAPEGTQAGTEVDADPLRTIHQQHLGYNGATDQARLNGAAQEARSEAQGRLDGADPQARIGVEEGAKEGDYEANTKAEAEPEAKRGAEEFEGEYSRMDIFQPEILKVAKEHIEKSWGIRFDGIGRLLKAPSETLRKLALGLSPDPTSRRQIRTVEEFAGDVTRVRLNAGVHQSAVVEKYHKGLSQDARAMMQLDEEANRILLDRSGVKYREASDMLKELVDTRRKFWDENRQMINEAGMLKDGLSTDPHYMYMPVNEGKVAEQLRRFGSMDNLKANTKEWVKQAVDEDYIKRRYDEALKEHTKAQEGRKNPEEYKSFETFKDQWATGWANTKLEAGFINLDNIRKHEGFSSNPDFLEHAAKLDRGLEVTGSDGQPFSLFDISTTNFWDSSTAYSQRLSGQYGVKMVYGKDVNELLKDVDTEIAAMRAKGDVGAATKYRKQFESTLSTAMGISPYASESVFYRTLATLRGAEHVKLAGGFGLNAVGEALGAVATLGLKAAFRIFGGLETTINSAKAGDMDAIDTLKFMEKVFGYDSMRLNLIDHRGFNDDFYAGSTDYSFAASLDKAAYKVNRAAQWANRITGFEALQRRTMEGIRLHLYEQMTKAIKGDASNGFMKYLDESRITQYGLTRAEFDAMASDAKRFLNERGNIDIDKWKAENINSYYTMTTLLGRMASEGIQKHSMNDLPTFFQHPIAQTLFQFMTFPVAAFSRNTLKTFRDRDRVAAMKLLGTSIGASLVYSSRMALNSLEQDDPQAYRDEKLALDRIALVGFSRSSFASILPSLTNSFVPYDIPGFADSRTTGNSNSVLGGAVTADVGRILKLGKSTMGWLTDEEFEYSDGDFKAAKQLALPNYLGLGLGFSYLSEAVGGD